MEPAFVVPAGVVFLIEEDGVTIENRGDVVLHTNFGKALKRVVSAEGSVILHTPVTAGLLHAAGNVQVFGGASVASLIAGGSVQVSGDLQAQSTQVGGGLDVTGNASADSIEVGGQINVGGGLSANRTQGGGLNVVGAAALQTVELSGGLYVSGGLTSGSIRAGELRVAGGAQLGTVQAGNVEISGPAVVARGLQASGFVKLLTDRIQVDVVVAPQVEVASKASGRINVLESSNEVGPNALKGCFSKADYAEMFGDADTYLRDRGIDPNGVVSAPREMNVPPPRPVIAAPPPTQAQVPQPPLPVAAPVIATPPPAPPAPAPAPVPVIAAAVVAAPAPEVAAPVVASAPVEEPTAIGGEEEIPEVHPEPVTETPPEHPQHKQLMEAVQKVVDAYVDAEVPPAVEKLKTLVETHAYDRVRGEITQIWSELLKFHQKKGVRLPHQVTPTFNTINSIVKKM